MSARHVCEWALWVFVILCFFHISLMQCLHSSSTRGKGRGALQLPGPCRHSSNNISQLSFDKFIQEPGQHVRCWHMVEQTSTTRIEHHVPPQKISRHAPYCRRQIRGGRHWQSPRLEHAPVVAIHDHFRSNHCWQKLLWNSPPETELSPILYYYIRRFHILSNCLTLVIIHELIERHKNV